MTIKPQTVFLAVTSKDEKEVIIRDLIRHSAEIKAKGMAPLENVFLLKPISFLDEEVSCRILGTSFLDTKSKTLIAQFDLHDHKYMSLTPYVRNGREIVLTFSQPLYRVQRRENFRLKLPLSFGGRLILHLGETPHSCMITDISAGGCKIEVSKKLGLQAGQLIPAIFQLQGLSDMHIDVSVRHTSEHPDKKDRELVGIQFTNQSEIVKNRMASLVMDLYREFFTNKS